MDELRDNNADVGTVAFHNEFGPDSIQAKDLKDCYPTFDMYNVFCYYLDRSENGINKNGFKGFRSKEVTRTIASAWF